MTYLNIFRFLNGILLLYIGLSTSLVSAQALTELSADDCQGCHMEIYQQWQSSMHAQSTPLKDPIHGAFYKKTVGSPTQENLTKAGKYPVCLKCHVPNAAIDKKTNILAKPSYQEGIGCVACHTMTHYKGSKASNGKLNLGVDAYQFSSTSLQGPTGNIGAAHPFPVQENASLLKSNDACMGCHDQRLNANKIPLCMTGTEFAESKQTVSCQSCHMPLVNGKADHSMLGGHSDAVVKQAIDMSIETRVDAGQLAIQLSVINKLPHSFPTGAPFRSFYIKVYALDAKENKLWSNSQSHPIKDDKKAMFMYTLGDENGKPTAPPMATQVLSDSRLSPLETRVLDYSIDVKGVVSIKAEAWYDLLLPPLKKKFAGKLPKELLKSKLAASAQVDL